MIAVLVDEPNRVEDLHRVVGVEARQDLRDVAEIAVDELAEPTVVVDRAGARAACNEELEPWDTECVLDVDGEETEATGVSRGRAEALLVGPHLRLAGTVLVRNAPNLADTARVEMWGERKLAHLLRSLASRQPARRSSPPSLT